MLDERSAQTVSTPFNIFKNKDNVESMLDESLYHFKFDSIRFQQAFNIFFGTCNNVERLFKSPRNLVQQSVERMLNQVLKLLKRAFKCHLFCSARTPRFKEGRMLREISRFTLVSEIVLKNHSW